MAHYALINDQNIVVAVITGKDENDLSKDWEHYYGSFHGFECRRTSYNTSGNRHLLGGTPFRKNFAAIGYTWDENKNAFIPPKPYASWQLNEETCNWEAPVPMPEPVPGQFWVWDEATVNWKAITGQEI